MYLLHTPMSSAPPTAASGGGDDIAAVGGPAIKDRLKAPEAVSALFMYASIRMACQIWSGVVAGANDATMF
jgi:hypothetical protein